MCNLEAANIFYNFTHRSTGENLCFYTGCTDRDMDGVPDSDPIGAVYLKDCDTREQLFNPQHRRHPRTVGSVQDECPDSYNPAFGTRSRAGCLDEDNDGIPNYRDHCPECSRDLDEVPGDPNGAGCPGEDSLDYAWHCW